MKPSTHPLFWRDPALPYIELRQVLDGHKVRYAPHSHKEWSIGAILNGDSGFLCGNQLYDITQGDIVIMNPNVVHACNPHKESPWAYYMMHIDVHWLTTFLTSKAIRVEDNFTPTSIDILRSPHFYNGFINLADNLMSDSVKSTKKEPLLHNYLSDLFSYLDQNLDPKEINHPFKKQNEPSASIMAVANYLDAHYLKEETIDQLSTQFGMSSGYLVRAFKKHFAMTPHAYRLNLRIQQGQQELKIGESISRVAQTVGFSDQAHFQRAFKQRVAATPKQYRRFALKHD